MEKIQEILFENKEKIPDGIYLELMNNLKLNADKYYKLEFVRLIPNVFFDNDDDSMVVQITENNATREVIIPVVDSKRSSHYDDLLKAGKTFVYSGNSLFHSFVDAGTNIRHKVFINNRDDSDDDADENLDCGCDCRNIHISTKFKLVPCYLISKITII